MKMCVSVCVFIDRLRLINIDSESSPLVGSQVGFNGVDWTHQQQQNTQAHTRTSLSPYFVFV